MHTLDYKMKDSECLLQKTITFLHENFGNFIFTFIYLNNELPADSLNKVLINRKRNKDFYENFSLWADHHKVPQSN